VTNEPALEATPEEQQPEPMSAEERTRLRRQMSEQAVKLAVSGRWEEAATMNRDMINLLGEQAETYNRLGKALSELGQATEARAAYTRSLELESTNTIAKRNLDKLATMQDASGVAPSQIDTRMFVEETGKSAAGVLQAVDADTLAEMDAGDVVEMQVAGNAVNVHSLGGKYLGMVEPRIGLRLSKLIQGGNRYSAALITTSGDVRVMIRETFQDPSQIGRVSFPKTTKTDVRAYTRRGLLRTEEDFELSEDDDEVVEEESDGWSEEDSDEAGPTSVNIEPEDESYD
jgi:tetratricopeptide (TPR) repeat protein